MTHGRITSHYFDIELYRAITIYYAEWIGCNFKRFGIYNASSTTMRSMWYFHTIWDANRPSQFKSKILLCVNWIYWEQLGTTTFGTKYYNYRFTSRIPKLGIRLEILKQKKMLQELISNFYEILVMMLTIIDCLYLLYIALYSMFILQHDNIAFIKALH